jgi:hypothetical protein
MGFITRLESRDHDAKDPGARSSPTSTKAGDLSARGLGLKKPAEGEQTPPDSVLLNEVAAISSSAMPQGTADKRFVHKRTMSLSTNPTSGSGQNPMKLVSLKSLAPEPSKVQKPAQSSRKHAEELVEIKPRNREREDINREARLEKSAFDELPPAEVYDPAWNTLPLRCEAGKLGRGPRKSPAGGVTGPLLPVAFKIQSSTDIGKDGDDEDEDYGGTDVEILEGQDDSPDSGKFARSSTRGRYSLGRMTFGTISFLTRKKRDGSTALEIFRVSDDLETTFSRLRSILTTLYRADVTSLKPGELRIKINNYDPDSSMTTEVPLVFVGEEADGQTRVTARRGRLDRSRLSSEIFCKLCSAISSKYKSTHPNTGLTTSLLDTDG